MSCERRFSSSVRAARACVSTISAAIASMRLCRSNVKSVAIGPFRAASVPRRMPVAYDSPALDAQQHLHQVRYPVALVITISSKVDARLEKDVLDLVGP